MLFFEKFKCLKCFMLKHTCFSLCPAEITTVCYLRRNAGVLTHARTDARARELISGRPVRAPFILELDIGTVVR